MTLPSEDRERLLLALRRVDPNAFRREVRAVLVAQEALGAAAQALRVDARTLAAWIAADPRLAAGLELGP